LQVEYLSTDRPVERQAQSDRAGVLVERYPVVAAVVRAGQVVARILAAVQDQAKAGIKQESHDESSENHEAYHLWLHHRLAESPVHEPGNLLRPLENPIEVVYGDEVEADGACRRNGMLPAGHLLHHHVIAIYADEPVDTANEHEEKEIQIWNGNFGDNSVWGVERRVDQFRDYSGKTKKIADPQLRELRQVYRLHVIGG